MERRSWFWRKIGFWFVPVNTATLGAEEWTKLRRMAQWNQSLRLRRVLVFGWVALLIFNASVSFRIARYDA
jgi:hypothetical protein